MFHDNLKKLQKQYSKLSQGKKTFIHVTLGISIIVIYKYRGTIKSYADKHVFNRNNTEKDDSKDDSISGSPTNYGKLDTKEDKEILKTHIKCPLMNVKTKKSRCIYYPPHNTAYIISVCCDKCVSSIQKSFNDAKSEYSISDSPLGGKELYKDGTYKQYLLPCSEEYLTRISTIAGTSIE